jgi:hypothetical protein
MRGRRAVLALTLLLAAGCTQSGSSQVDPPAATAAASSSGPSSASHACPGQRAQPDPHRPVVTLAFSLDADLRTVTGTESVAFTPDRPTGELVFRLVPNGPDTSALGNQLTVMAARGKAVASSGYESAGAAAPGGLYVVALADRLAAGESTTVELDFTLRLGNGGFERLGAVQDVSWWGSGAPLLAWDPRVGWLRDPFVALSGETATSPASDTTISVDAPAALTVLMTGHQDGSTGDRGGRRTWTSHEPAARDVSVAVGSFATAVTQVAGVRVTTGVLPGSGQEAARLARATGDAIEQLSARFGAFPYATLTVPSLPDAGGGIEYPSSIQLASTDDTVLVHEVAHMWFYGMVGDSQFQDPWLDEAFASYAESVTGDPPVDQVARLLATSGDVGGSMASFPDDSEYVTAVYGKGAAMLLTARQRAGAEAFDAALRCYVDARAWSIAHPADVATALADLPAALAVLQDAGALDPEDLPR